MTEQTTAGAVDIVPEQPRVTIAQVARLAGVSPTTVSHVLSGKRIVGATTRVAVQRRRANARIPAQPRRPIAAHRQFQMVAVIVPDLTNTYYSVLTVAWPTRP